MSERADITAHVPRMAAWLQAKGGREIRIRNEGSLGARFTLDERIGRRRWRREMSLAIESLTDVALLDFAFEELISLVPYTTEANA